MTSSDRNPQSLTCTAFADGTAIAKGAYVPAALVINQFARKYPNLSVLVFDDATGTQIDFDLRGSEQEIAGRIAVRFQLAGNVTQRAPGRPRLGVVSREVTLLPRHWQWLAEQPGGASVTLRRLIEQARRSEPANKLLLRKLQERTSRFLTALAGDFPGYEEATRALFADDIATMKSLIAAWPSDVQDYVVELSTNAATLPPSSSAA